MRPPSALVAIAAYLRAPQRRRLLPAATISAGIVATIVLYGLFGRPGTRRIAIVVQQSAAASPSVAPSASASAAPRATATATRTPRPTATPTATPPARPPFDAASLLPLGASISDELDLRDANGQLVAVALVGTLAADGGCSAAFLDLFAIDEGGWTQRFDGASAPAEQPWFADQTPTDCAAPPQLAPLGVPAQFVGVAGLQADNSARLIALDEAGAVRLELRTAGAGSITTNSPGTIELDEPPAQAPSALPGAAAGSLARIVSVVDGAPSAHARLLPNCDRGRLQPGSAAAAIAAAGGSAGTVSIACSSGATAAARIDGDTLLDLLAAPATAVRDRDYVELGYDDASLNVDPQLTGDPPLPRLALLTDNSAAMHPTPGAPPPSSTRPPATRVSSSGGGSSSAAAPAARPAATHAASGSGSSSASTAANTATHGPVPTRPAATRPVLQPPAPPASAANGAPP